jgi:hypothetical protein
MPLYRVKIYKSFKGRAGAANQWSNEYAIESNDALDGSAIVTAVMKLVNFEKGFHLQNINFMRAVLSTYARESSRSDPTAFRVIELTGTGGADLPTTTETNILAICLRVKFGAVTGRGGQKYYRGCVTEAMVTAGTDGAPSLVSPPYGFDATAGNLLTQLGTGVLMTPNTKDTSGETAHEVTAISISGLSIHKTHVRRKKKDSGGVDASTVIETLGSLAVGAASVAAFFLSDGASAAPEIAVAARPIASRIITALRTFIESGGQL